MNRGLVGTWVVAISMAAACAQPDEPIRMTPVVVVADYRMAPVVVRGATRSWWKNATHAARFGDPVPVGISMYCLQGTTRRGQFVRLGIAAADPHFFPLAQSIELYAGRKLLGQFLIDDTGDRIVGNRIDIWTPNCREARRFGLQRGTAVRVRGEPQVQLSGSAAPGKTRRK